MRRIVFVASAFGLVLGLASVPGCDDGSSTGGIQETAERKKVDQSGQDAMRALMESKGQKKAK